MRNRNKQMYLAAISHMTVEQLGNELWHLLNLENDRSVQNEKLLRRISKLQQQSDKHRNIAISLEAELLSCNNQLKFAQKCSADSHRENQALRLELTNARRDYEEQQRKLVQAVSGAKMWQSEAQRERKKAEAAQASMQQEHATNQELVNQYDKLVKTSTEQLTKANNKHQELVSEINTIQNKLAENTKVIVELKRSLQTSRDAHDQTCLELYRRNDENAKLSKELGQRTHALECALSKLNELGVDGVDLPKDGVKFSNFVYSKPPQQCASLQRQLDQLADEHRELQDKIELATRRIEHQSKLLQVTKQYRDTAIRQRDDAVNSLSHMCKQRDEARKELAKYKTLEEVNKKHFGEAADYSKLEERIMEHLVKTACEVKKPKRTITVEFYRATR
jgi:chromosome segregation ATPase